MPTDDRPQLHVHVSGSAGTSMCAMARQQKPLFGHGHAGGSYACLYGCKSPATWELFYAMRTRQERNFHRCMSHFVTCDSLEAGLRRGGFGVLGAVETVLDESNSSEYLNATLAFRHAMLHRPCENSNCCGCNSAPILRSSVPRIYYERANQTTALVVKRGGPSPFDALWPPEGWRPLTTYCANIRYSFLMHEPIHRLLSQLRLQCPRANKSNVPAWSMAMLRFIYDQDLVLDTEDGGKGFPATAAVSNFNTRFLLGPRVHFARLGGIRQVHHDATLALLDKYSLVMPVRSLGHPNASAVIASALGWSSLPRVPKANRHERARTDREEAVIIKSMGEELREHNRYDLLTYDWVQQRFAQRVAMLAADPFTTAHRR